MICAVVVRCCVAVEDLLLWRRLLALEQYSFPCTAPHCTTLLCSTPTNRCPSSVGANPVERHTISPPARASSTAAGGWPCGFLTFFDPIFSGQTPERCRPILSVLRSTGARETSETMVCTATIPIRCTPPAGCETPVIVV
uniref:Uncharacterized protein n=1 Tax=Pseudo-nitzschia australis TaxID=44445 RepID=A0A7S4EJX8_9STRA